MIVNVNGVALDVPEDATPDEIDEVFQGHLKEMAAGTAKSFGGPSTIRPTQQIPGGVPDPMNLGQTIRAWGHEIPGAEPLAAAGDYVQNLVTGKPQTWEGTLEARRRAGAEAAGEERGAALGGALTAAAVTPWSKGAGVAGVLKRAAQAAGLTGLTRLSQGENVGGATGEGLASAGLSTGIESLLSMIPIARETVGPGLRRWASERAWRATDAKPMDEINLVNTFDPEGTAAASGVGDFLRDAKTQDGNFVLRGNSEDVYRAIQKYLSETGPEKGRFVDLAQERGARVNTDEVSKALDDLLRGIDTPANRVVHPAIGPEIDAFRQRFLSEYADKPVRLATDRSGAALVSRPGSGATSGEIPEGFREPSNPQSQLLPPEQTTKVPIYEGASAPGASSTGASPAMMAEAEEGSALAAPEIVASYERTGPAPFAPTHIGEGALDKNNVPLKPIVRGDRVLSQETTRPAPGSGWSPVLLPAENMPINQWEDLKSTLQNFVNKTRSGLSRPDRGIVEDPSLDLLNRFSGVVRSADEKAAADVLSPEELAAFLRIKKMHGQGSELKPVLEKAKAVESTAGGTSAAQDARRFGRSAMIPFGTGAAMGGATFAGTGGNVAQAAASAALGYSAARAAQAFEHANPNMARIYDAAGRALMSLPETPVGMGARRAPAIHGAWDKDPVWNPQEVDMETLLKFLRTRSQESTP